MLYDKGEHCVFYHRYHIVWSTKYRFKVLRGELQMRVREIIRRVRAENDAEIVRGVLSGDHVQMFVSIPPKLAVSDLVRKMKGPSSRKIQQEFPAIANCYWGRRFWGRGYFSTTNRVITQDVVLNHLENHIADPTGASR